MPVSADGGSFAQILAAAQSKPPSPDGDGKDLSDGFPLPVAEHHRVVDTSKDPAARGVNGLIAYDFETVTVGFTVFRPWEACERCREDIANMRVTLPSVGDYSCPHTNSKEYDAVVNKILAAEYLGQVPKNPTTVLPNGTHITVLTYYVPKFNPKKARKLSKDARRGAVDDEGAE